MVVSQICIANPPLFLYIYARILLGKKTFLVGVFVKSHGKLLLFGAPASNKMARNVVLNIEWTLAKHDY